MQAWWRRGGEEIEMISKPPRDSPDLFHALPAEPRFLGSQCKWFDVHNFSHFDYCIYNLLLLPSAPICSLEYTEASDGGSGGSSGIRNSSALSNFSAL